jgi:hypothetical protein
MELIASNDYVLFPLGTGVRLRETRSNALWVQMIIQPVTFGNRIIKDSMHNVVHLCLTNLMVNVYYFLLCIDWKKEMGFILFPFL